MAYPRQRRSEDPDLDREARELAHSRALNWARRGERVQGGAEDHGPGGGERVASGERGGERVVGGAHSSRISRRIRASISAPSALITARRNSSSVG